MRRLVPFLISLVVLLVAAAEANANFVYWANSGQTSIGRAKINGGAVNNAFIANLTNVHGVAVNSNFIYWTQGSGATSSIGRANLDGSGVNPNFLTSSSAGLNFVPGSPPAGIAVNSAGIYWVNGGTATIGRANIDGSAPNASLINVAGATVCGIAATDSFVYWLDSSIGQRIGRADAFGGSPNLTFIPNVSANCGLAADNSFLYWGAGNQAVGRAPIGGGAGSADNTFIPNAAQSGNLTCGVAVNSQYVFWGNTGPSANFIGRANLGGGSPNPALIAGPTNPCLMTAAPANKITVNSITKNTKKGTATISAKVPGPGQVSLDQSSTPPDTNAVASAVQSQALMVTSASSFSLTVTPIGKTAKKLKKQVKKEGKGKVKQTVFIHFVPAGVAGVPNDQAVTVTLVRHPKKKKKH